MCIDFRTNYSPLISKELLPTKFQRIFVENREVGIYFGSFGGKIYTGIFAEIHQNELEIFLPKDIHSLLDAEPIVPKQLEIENLNYFWNINSVIL